LKTLYGLPEECVVTNFNKRVLIREPLKEMFEMGPW
jgi:hypothetical protein